MSLHEDISLSIRTEIDRLGSSIALSPTTLAIAVQNAFGVDGIGDHLRYASLEHIKAMARKELGRRFDSDGEENTVYQADMFSGKLQDAYPIPLVSGCDPIYKPREQLSDFEINWNIQQLRKSAKARLQHADALQAWADSRAQAKAA